MTDAGSLFTMVAPSGMAPDVEFHYSDRVIALVKGLHPIMPILIYSKEDIFASYCTNEYILKQGYSVAEYRGLLDLFYMACTRLSYCQAHSDARHAAAIGQSAVPTASISSAWGFIASSFSGALDLIVKQRSKTPVEIKNKPIVQGILKKPLAATNYETALTIIVDQYIYELQARQAKSSEQVSPSTAKAPSAVTVAIDDGGDVEHGGDSNRNGNKPVSPFKKKFKSALAYNEMHNVWLGENMLLFDYTGPDDPAALEALFMERYVRRTLMAKKLLAMEKKKPVAGHVGYFKKFGPSVPILPNEKYIGQNVSGWYSLAKQQIEGKLLIRAHESGGDGDNAQPIVDPTWQWCYDPSTESLMCPRLVFHQIMLVMHEFRLYGIQEQMDACALEMQVLRMKHWEAHGRAEDEMRLAELPTKFARIENGDARYQLLHAQCELLSEAKISGAKRVEQLCGIINERAQTDIGSRKRVLRTISNYKRSLVLPIGVPNKKIEVDEHTFIVANGIGIGDAGNDEEDDSDEEAEEAGNGESQPTCHLKPAIACLVELITDKTLPSFDYLAISRALNFFASHDTMRTEQDLELLRKFPDSFVEIKLKEAGLDTPIGSTFPGAMEFTEDREASCHARYFPYLFYTLVRYFAMPYLDISLVTSDTSSLTSSSATALTKGPGATANATQAPIGGPSTFRPVQTFTQFALKGLDPLPADTKVPGNGVKPIAATAETVLDSAGSQTLGQVIKDYKEANKVKSTTVFGETDNVIVYPIRYVDEKAKVVFDTLVFPPQAGSKPGPSLAKARKEDHAAAVWYIYPR
jgi:hypothetical protein